MRIYSLFYVLALSVFSSGALAQQIPAPEPEAGSIIGTVTDVADGIIPASAVTVDGPSSDDHHFVIANDEGFFKVTGLHPGVDYHVTIAAKGFATWIAPSVIVHPGQEFELTGIKLKPSVVETTVAAVTVEQLATEQVSVEEKQRVLGVIPNFYVVYDRNAVPLTAKLKYKLALRAATDVVSIAGAATLAGINQAADTPDYVQGAKGYGQRFGAAYADGFSDILIGGAFLPSLLHQDPRYFYQGTGSRKSRTLHAISSPFICKGDNGHPQFNYSSIGGDLASGALSNLYYPESNRGTSTVFTNALITTGGRIANALAQEFILRRLTSHTDREN